MNKTNLPTSDKKTLRAVVQESIARLSSEEKEKESQKVCVQLIKILSDKYFETLITYDAFDDEINISYIDGWVLEKGKLIQIIPQSIEAFEVPENAILIVPGRAFTKEGKRIGRGSGYYDKLIEKYPNLQTIGVCFFCQVFGDIPEESWDRRVDEVVFAGNTLE